MSNSSDSAGNLDLAGVGSFLATGVPMAGHTLWQSVSATPALPVSYSGDLADTDPRVLEDELFDLVVAAVEKHVPRGPLWLSLSAGYDARTILGVLQSIGVKDVTCFSYANGRPPVGSDPYLAAKLASLCGYRHELVTSYRGDLASTILRNAEWGQGETNFCDEADAWQSLSDRGIIDLMVGDEALGWIDWPLRTTADVLDSLYISDVRALSTLRRYAPDAHECLTGAYRSVLSKLAGRVAGIENRHDQKDMLYVEQRLHRVILPWRFHFAGRIAQRVHNPLLDGDVLAFVQRLPADDRINKRLFRRAVRRHLPEVFEVPIASASSYVPSWSNELRRKPASIDGLLTGGSALDELISPSAIRSIIEVAPSFGARVHAEGRRIVRAAARRLPAGGGRAYRGAAALSETTLALRLLVLRQVLRQ